MAPMSSTASMKMKAGLLAAGSQPGGASPQGLLFMYICVTVCDDVMKYLSTITKTRHLASMLSITQTPHHSLSKGNQVHGESLLVPSTT